MSARSRLRRQALATGSALAISVLSCFQPAHAAKDVALVSGAFIRSISVADLSYLAETGEARGLLANLLKLSRQDPAEVANLLNQEIDLPLVLTSRLMSTRIGEVLSLIHI